MDKTTKCGGCEKSLRKTPTDIIVSCSACNTKYLKGCLALTPKANVGADWVCPICKKNKRRGDNSHTPVRGLVADTGLSTPTEVIDRHTNSSPEDHNRLPSAGTSDSSLDNLAIFRRDLADLVTELRGCRQEMALLRETITDLSSRLISAEKRLDALEQGSVGGTGAEKINELERSVAELKLDLNDRDQDALLADLDIGHLPEEKGENVTHTVTVLASRLGVMLEGRDVVFAERVGVPPAEGGRPRRVVVRLARRDLRDELIKAARVRRGLASDGGARVFVNERLTRHNRLLYRRVREACNEKKWRYSWTRRGRVYARQSDGGPVHHFRTESDIFRVFGSQ